MRPVSPQFLTTIRGSHTIAMRCRVVVNTQTGTAPTGIADLDVIDGDVTLDASSNVRGTLDLTVSGLDANGRDIFTRQSSGPLTPYGNEIFVERGITYATGTREYVSQGYYRIYKVEQDDRPGAPIRIAARDRMSGIIDARLVAPIQFMSGTSIATIFNTLVLEVYPTAVITYDFNPNTTTITRDQIADEDRYGFLRDLVKSRGKTMFWDYAGRLVIMDPPDTSNIVFDVNAGAGGVLVSVGRQLDREGVYNAVVAIGQAPDGTTPVRAVARDMNPNSITFWNGPFGKVPRYYFSTFVTTDAQAGTAAQKILEQSLGLPYNVNFAMVPNPALEPLDPIQITHPSGYEYHVIDRITIPLRHDRAMTASTREQTDVVIEVTG